MSEPRKQNVDPEFPARVLKDALGNAKSARLRETQPEPLSYGYNAGPWAFMQIPPG